MRAKFLKALAIAILFSLSLFWNFTGSAPSVAFGADAPPEGLSEDRGPGPHLRRLRERGVVLALSGGGTKGLAHIGVFRVLERENIPIIGIVGTSIGSIMGGLYACGYSADELEDLMKSSNFIELLSDKATKINLNTMGNSSAADNASDALYSVYFDRAGRAQGPMGAVSAQPLFDFLSKLTAKYPVANFNELQIPFAAVATDLSTGEAVVMRRGDLASVLRASMSIPGVFDPWEIEGRLFIDGGVVANLPVDIARECFPGYPILAVNLSGTSIEKDVSEFRSVFDVLAQTLDIMTIGSIRENQERADLVLIPGVQKFGILDSSGYDRIIQRGVDVALAHIDAIRELPDKHVESARVFHRLPVERRTPLVKEVQAQGLAPSQAEFIERRSQYMIARPLDMNDLQEEAEKYREWMDLQRMTIHVDRTFKRDHALSDDAVVTFDATKKKQWEAFFRVYTTNFHTNRWVSATVVRRELFAPGDSASFEYRFGQQWGSQLQYFSPFKAGGQWGFVMNARREELTPQGMGNLSWERYAARVVRYWESNKIRVGLGVAAETLTSQSFSEGGDADNIGPYFYFSFINLDNKLSPTRGFALFSDMWYPTNSATLLSRTVWNAYLPFQENWRIVFSGGLETGNVNETAHRAYLGDQEELYSLANNPLWGEQAAWVHLGLNRTLMKSWWGRVNAELFATYGMVMIDWNRTDDYWESGISLSIPGQFLEAKLIMVYDQSGQTTFGFSIGRPTWWNSPLP